jgi:hypothetical protein
MIQGEAQSYMGKSPILKGIGKLYGGLWRSFSAGVDFPSHDLACIVVSGPALRRSPGIVRQLVMPQIGISASSLTTVEEAAEEEKRGLRSRNHP